ncbi:MAG: hypothetical protein QXS89_05180 [Sulfolobales archaeon]
MEVAVVQVAQAEVRLRASLDLRLRLAEPKLESDFSSFKSLTYLIYLRKLKISSSEILIMLMMGRLIIEEAEGVNAYYIVGKGFRGYSEDLKC